MFQATDSSAGDSLGLAGLAQGQEYMRHPVTKLINAHNRSVAEPSRALPHARMHDLRHLHATTLLLAGVPVHVVAARLGHADPAVTLRVYAHVLREQAATVGDIFAQAVKTSVSKSVSKPSRQD